MTGILALLTLLIVLFGGGGGGQNARHKPPPQTQPQSPQKTLANVPPASPSKPNAVSVPTPALLPGLIGLGAAALRKRKSAIVTPED